MVKAPFSKESGAFVFYREGGIPHSGAPSFAHGGKGVFRIPMRVPFCTAKKESKSGQEPRFLISPFILDNNQFSLLLMPPSVSLGGVPRSSAAPCFGRSSRSMEQFASQPLACRSASASMVCHSIGQARRARTTDRFFCKCSP